MVPETKVAQMMAGRCNMWIYESTPVGSQEKNCSAGISERLNRMDEEGGWMHGGGGKICRMKQK